MTDIDLTIRNLVNAVKLDTIEACAKIVEPEGPRPCSCDHCYCGNYGDAERVAAWDAETYKAKAIRALAITSEERS